MKLSRSKLSEPDRRFIIARSGGCCNKCKIQVFQENELGEKARLGDDAHIWAYSEDGPRGGNQDVPLNRNTCKNIILLCKNCHAEIDQQTEYYSPQKLKDMREEHYSWVCKCLGGTVAKKPEFHYILYLNIIRLDMYAAANSIALPTVNFDGANTFRELGINAGRVMSEYTQILDAEDIYAHQIKKHSNISRLEAGQYCFFEPLNFRTLGITGNKNAEISWEEGKSIIYHRFSDWELVCQIDPRWITTSTAASTLRSGQAQLCGTIRINQINIEKKKVIASPLFLAHPGDSSVVQ
nr:hypothetical protein BN993_03195 [Virgibacillus halodenitrificans]